MDTYPDIRSDRTDSKPIVISRACSSRAVDNNEWEFLVVAAGASLSHSSPREKSVLKVNLQRRSV